VLYTFRFFDGHFPLVKYMPTEYHDSWGMSSK
jgi:hypothetical protein